MPSTTNEIKNEYELQPWRIGTYYAYDLTIYQADGVTSKDVSGDAFTFTVRRYSNDTTPLFKITEADDIVDIDMENGQIQIIIKSSKIPVGTENGIYNFDLVWTAAGEEPVAIMWGKVKICDSIYKSTDT